MGEHRWMLGLRRVARVALGLALPLCAVGQGEAASSAGAPARSAAMQVLPPYTAAYEPQGIDERGIWMMADEDERSLRDSRFLIRDRRLTDYVESVLCRAVGSDRCRGVRIYVVRVAAFNATMMPNGTMQVWSGLLLRVRSESELAAILGHEFAHFESRHSLAGYRQRRAAFDIAAWAGFLGGYAAPIQASAVGAIFQFNRDQEKQADLLSLQYMRQSPYSAQAFSHIWQRLMDEADATALGRKQRSRRYDRVAFFSTHPPELERATYLADLAKDAPAHEEGEAAYRLAMAPWLPDFLTDQLKLNDFGGTEYLLAALSGGQWTSPLLYARGELYRQRGNPRDLVAAAGFYQAALASDPALVDAYRGLGLSLLRSQREAEGAAALRTYLDRRPDATDAAMLKTLITS